MKNALYAWTQTLYRGYPGFVNLSEENGHVDLMVRSSGGLGTQVAVLTLPPEALTGLAQAINEYLTKK